MSWLTSCREIRMRSPRPRSFQDDLGADSLDVVELVMGFEDEFNIQIPDDEAEQIKTVGQAANYIDEKMAG